MPAWTPRRHIRLHFDGQIAVVLRRKTGTNVIPGECRNLSEGGLAAALAQSLDVGQRVLLPVFVPNLRPAEVRARVCYSNGALHGFEFQREEARSAPCGQS